MNTTRMPHYPKDLCCFRTSSKTNSSTKRH